MLRCFPTDLKARADAPGPLLWADLCEATAAEVADVEKRLGARVPTREELSEVERSSRLRAHDGVLTMSVPLVSPAEGGEASPVGFVLSRDTLVTVRFGALPSFDAVAARFEDATTRPTSSLQVFVDLCDEIIDRLADKLEHAAGELGAVSSAIFHVSESDGRAAIRSNRRIRAQLRQVGRLGDRLSDARSALVAVGRAVDFASELTRAWSTGDDLEPRMRSLRQDVTSLDDYQVHLSDKVQFLLDAMVGLIGIAQNDVFKFLTIVSIVGIPPTLVAGIYGMNFKYMPEYNWALGYPFGLAVIALSAILPLLWFKWRGWF